MKNYFGGTSVSPKEMLYSVIRVERDEWLLSAPAFLDYNFCNFFEYAQAAARRRGAKCEHVFIKDGARVLGAAAVRVFNIGFLPLGLAYVRWGPICKRDKSSYAEMFQVCLEGLIQHYVKERHMVLRIVPPYREVQEMVCQANTLSNLGFRPSNDQAPHHSIIKAINCGDDELRESLDKKWHYELRRALRVELSLISGTSDKLFAQFEYLYSGLRRRKKFFVDQDAAFFRSVQARLSPTDRFDVYLATHKGQVVAGYVGSLVGDTAVYLLGATDDRGLEYRAGYWLQWQVMRVARDKGMQWYDLNGFDRLTTPEVSRFKSRMGGREVIANGPVEIGTGLVSRVIGASSNIARNGLMMLRRQ